MKKARVFFIIFLLFSLILNGCGQTHYLEEMGLQIAIGYDRLDDHRILGTSVFHQFDPEASKPVSVMSSTALTSKGIRQTMNLESNKKLVSGQLRIALYGEETAKKGIISLIDSISRDPAIGEMMYLGVTKGKANDLLSYKYKNIDNIGTFLYELNEQNIHGEQIVSNTLHEFSHDYQANGKDPILPYFERKGEEVKVTGTAIFNDDRMVGVLPIRENFCIKLLRDRFKLGTFEISIPQGKIKKYIKGKGKGNGNQVYLALDNINSDAKIKLTNKETNEFAVKIKLSARILEISEEVDFSNAEAIKAIEQSLNKCLENNVIRTIDKLKKYDSDPIGFGKVYLTSVRGAQGKKSTEELRKIYKESKIRVEANSTIVRTGVVD